LQAHELSGFQQAAGQANLTCESQVNPRLAGKWLMLPSAAITTPSAAITTPNVHHYHQCSCLAAGLKAAFWFPVTRNRPRLTSSISGTAQHGTSSRPLQLQVTSCHAAAGLPDRGCMHAAALPNTQYNGSPWRQQQGSAHQTLHKYLKVWTGSSSVFDPANVGAYAHSILFCGAHAELC